MPTVREQAAAAGNLADFAKWRHQNKVKTLLKQSTMHLLGLAEPQYTKDTSEILRNYKDVRQALLSHNSHIISRLNTMA